MPLNITTDSINDAFIQAAKRLHTKPDFTPSPRGWQINEIINANICITNPYNRIVTNYHRRISLKYLVGEWLWYERGSNSLDEISYYSSFWKSISDDSKTSNSAYGFRIVGKHNGIKINQWEWAKKQMINDKDTRRSIILITLPDDMKSFTKDFPCTIALQFFIRDNLLYLIAIMRSNDLVLGFTYDASTFTLFQEKMLIELTEYYPSLEIGTYTHITTSLHSYKKHHSMLESVIANTHNNIVVSMPRMSDIEEITILQKNEEIIRTNSLQNLTPLKDPFCLWCQNILLKGK